MITLVHLADERTAASIRKNGIKVGKHRPGIFCMPLLPSFYLSHQWLRELKRRGVNTMVGVYFKVDSQTKVYAGHYNKDHQHIELGEAIRQIQAMEDPLGYEIIIDRKITASEIFKINSLPQNIGWRYKPRANGTRPCACDYCIRGTIKANRIRQKYEPREKYRSYPQLLDLLRKEDDLYEISHLLAYMRSKRRREDPTALLFLLDKNESEIDQDLARTLKVFRHKATKSILINLLSKEDADTREYAAESLLEIYKEDAIALLNSYTDEVIQLAIARYSEE